MREHVEQQRHAMFKDASGQMQLRLREVVAGGFHCVCVWGGEGGGEGRGGGGGRPGGAASRQLVCLPMCMCHAAARS
jgi:hypothetical protein